MTPSPRWLALADFEALFGHPLADLCEVDTQTGQIKAALTIVTDNGGPFRSFRFASFVVSHPELTHVRTRVKSPGQNGSRERRFGTLKYERLFIDEIDDAVMLAKHAAEGSTPRPGRPHYPHISNQGNPANFLTRDIYSRSFVIVVGRVGSRLRIRCRLLLESLQLVDLRR
ncbi:hypothetical protein [Actinopolymorpha alba]|uniref:hypothetical protein n=1 Tax=Actinopolymorpha alba TaxID=533267 RepID=UPI0003A0D798|nr:hypothetical protein [Actinopolymorpha alba]